jgi:hypothetical protein
MLGLCSTGVLRRALLLCAAAAVPVHATTLVTGPESAIYVAPTVYDGRFSAVLGDRSVATPTWFVAQWSNPEPLTKSLRASPGRDWTVSNDTTRIGFLHAPNPAMGVREQTYELAQSGVAPKHPLACGTEYDLFLSPNSGGIYATPTGTAAASRFAQSGPIGELTALKITLGLDIAREVLQHRCAVNYVSYVAAITLNSSAGYSMFYQVVLRDSRGELFDNSSCDGYPANGAYCYSSSIEYVTGQAMPTPGSGRTAVAVDFLRRLEQVIAATADPDRSHWSVSGFYVGQLMQGAMQPSSRWDSILLEAY